MLRPTIFVVGSLRFGSLGEYRLNSCGRFFVCTLSDNFTDGLSLMSTQEVIDAAEVLTHASATKLIHLGHQSVEELTVMAHDDGSTVEGLNGLFQHFLGRNVKVIGGLIENEQVDRREQQPNHGQTRSLTTGEHLHVFLTRLTSKHERAKQVVDLQSHIARRHLVDGVVNGQRLIEQLGLVLCEIAYLHVVANLQLAGEGYLSHDTLDERRLTLTVLSDEGNLLATTNGHVDMVEDGVRAIVLAHVVADDREVTTAQTGRELQVHHLVVDLVHLDRHDLLQLTDALLHLDGLGGLITEAFDKRLRVGNLLLLVLPRTQLLFTALLA